MYVLAKWKVEVSPNVSSLIKCFLTAERGLSGPTAMPTLVVGFSLHASFDQAQELHDLVCQLMSPLLDLKDMLCYFSACDSVLFHAYVEKELETAVKQFTRSEAMMSPSATFARSSMMFVPQRDVKDEDEKQQNAQEGLVSVEVKITSM